MAARAEDSDFLELFFRVVSAGKLSGERVGRGAALGGEGPSQGTSAARDSAILSVFVVLSAPSSYFPIVACNFHTIWHVIHPN